MLEERIPVSELEPAITDQAQVDPVSLEIFRSLFTAITEEMGAVLARCAYSPNIKERRDFSCALFDSSGRLIAQAAHIPVHLGAMPDSVDAVLRSSPSFAPGDVIALNDPFEGGTHLPDVTLISPIFSRQNEAECLIGFAANRAHHSDIGGMSPGSMPIATDIFQEGLIIPPIKLWQAGEPNDAALALILRNVRTPEERRGDLAAQVAANNTGIRRLQEIVDHSGLSCVEAHVDALIAYAERVTRTTIRALPNGEYHFTDQLDDDGISDRAVPVKATVVVHDDELDVDFNGSATETIGNINAVAPVTKSAVYYAIRCLMPEDAPANQGTFAPIRVIAPSGTVVNARSPRPVAGGNVECSQRIVDAVLGALAQCLPNVVPAASQGTMNNVTAGGIDPRTEQPFAYYETMGGGMGARPGLDGLSGVHVHMSNTLNTPVEAFEYAYPMRVVQYCLREGSGGDGASRGGSGLIREIEFNVSTEVTLLAERRRFPPYGLQGGEPGAEGEHLLIRNDGQRRCLPGKVSFHAEAGDRLRIASPGGGGWGTPHNGREVNTTA